MKNFRKYVIILITLFLVTITFATSAGAYNYGGSSASISGTISSGGNYGYVLEFGNADNAYGNIVGYRFSVVDGNGAIISKTIDVYRLDSSGTPFYYTRSDAYVGYPKKNKCKLIDDKSFSAVINDTDCYYADPVGTTSGGKIKVLNALPYVHTSSSTLASRLGTWLEKDDNINPILLKMQTVIFKRKSISQFDYGERLIVEPIFKAYLYVAGSAKPHMLTLSEIAVYGLNHIDDAYGGISSNGNNFGNIANFTNYYFPRYLLVDNAATAGKPDGDNVLKNIAIRAYPDSDRVAKSCSSGYRYTFSKILNSAYGMALVWNEDKPMTPLKVRYDCFEKPGGDSSYSYTMDSTKDFTILGIYSRIYRKSTNTIYEQSVYRGVNWNPVDRSTFGINEPVNYWFRGWKYDGEIYREDLNYKPESVFATAYSQNPVPSYVWVSAVWFPNIYRIECNKDGGTGGWNEFYERYGASYHDTEFRAKIGMTPKTKIEIPSKSGYSFGGYYSEAGGNGELIVNSAGEIVKDNKWYRRSRTVQATGTEKIDDKYVVKGKATVYAKWIKDTTPTYTIKYYVNGWEQPSLEQRGVRPNSQIYESTCSYDNRYVTAWYSYNSSTGKFQYFCDNDPDTTFTAPNRTTTLKLYCRTYVRVYYRSRYGGQNLGTAAFGRDDWHNLRIYKDGPVSHAVYATTGFNDTTATTFGLYNTDALLSAYPSYSLTDGREWYASGPYTKYYDHDATLTYADIKDYANEKGQVILYARWVANITYKLDGITDSTRSHACCLGGTYNIKTIPTKTNHKVLSSWYSNSNCATKVSSGTKTCDSNKTYYTKSYIFVYYYKGAGTPKSDYCTDDSGLIQYLSDESYYRHRLYTQDNTTVSSKSGLTNVDTLLTRTGYSGKEWQARAGDKKTYDYDDTTLNYTGMKGSADSNGNVILEPRWTANTLSVIYNANGGTASNATISGTLYYNGESTSSGKVAGDMYHSTSSSTKSTYMQVRNYGEQINLVNASSFGLTRFGYVFAGWGIASNTSYTATVATNENTANQRFSQSVDYNLSKLANINTRSQSIRLYAIWQPNTYTITYKWSDGTPITGLTPDKYTYGTGATLASVPSATGHTTSGWYTSSACTGSTVSSIGTTATGNKTFYAKKVANTYTITYRWSDGTNDMGTITGLTPTTFTYGTTPALPTKSQVTKALDYYQLVDVWYTDLACSSARKISSVPTSRSSNLTVYAKVRPNTLTINYFGNRSTSAKGTQVEAFWNLPSGGTKTFTDYETTNKQQLRASSVLKYDRKTTLPNGNTSYVYVYRTGHTMTGNWRKNGVLTHWDDEWIAKDLATKYGLDLRTGDATLDLYIDWQANVYNISYKWADGTAITDRTPTSYTYGVGVSASNMASVPSVIGYTTSGWFTTATGNTKKTSISTTDLGNITLYAKRTPITYKVVLYENFNMSKKSESDRTKTINMTYDQVETLLAASSYGWTPAVDVIFHNKDGSIYQTKLAYGIFKGWSLSRTGVVKYNAGDTIKNLTTTNDATINLYGLWDLGSVEVPELPNSPEWEESTDPPVNPPGENPKPGDDLTPVDDCEYDPVFGYTLVYHENFIDGNDIVSDRTEEQTVRYSETEKTTLFEPTWDNSFTATFYNPDGTVLSSEVLDATAVQWMTENVKTGMVTTYQFGQVVDSNWIDHGDFHLYEDWTLGSTTAPDVDLPGYDLIGWIEEDGVIPTDPVVRPEGPVDVEPGGTITPDEDTDYVPVFKPIIYDIILDKNGGDGGDDIIYEHYTHNFHDEKNHYPESVIDDVDIPFKEYYKFVGYYTDITDGVQVIDEDGNIIVDPDFFTEDTTIYARWELLTYEIIFDANGGEGDMPNQVIPFNTPTALNENTYTNTEGNFIGWNTETDGSGAQIADKQVVNNLFDITTLTPEEYDKFHKGEFVPQITIYAQWSSHGLYVLPIAPNSVYVRGTDVVSSFYLHNDGLVDLIPSDEISVRFAVFDSVSYERISDWVSFDNEIAPSEGKQLLYFKWTVPEDYPNDNVMIRWLIHDKDRNPYGSVPTSWTLPAVGDRIVTERWYDEYFNDWNKPGFVPTPAYADEGDKTVSWTEWDYVDGEFVEKTSTVNISASAELDIAQYSNCWRVCDNCGLDNYRDATVCRHCGAVMDMSKILVTRGGYSVIPTGTVTVTGDNPCYTASQFAWELLPENNYDNIYVSQDGTLQKFLTMEFIDGKWQLTQNPDFYVDDEWLADNRSHYIPCWYREGLYKPVIEFGDIWTPAGMITVTANCEQGVMTEGTLADDDIVGG